MSQQIKKRLTWFWFGDKRAHPTPQIGFVFPGLTWFRLHTGDLFKRRQVKLVGAWDNIKRDVTGSVRRAEQKPNVCGSHLTLHALGSARTGASVSHGGGQPLSLFLQLVLLVVDSLLLWDRLLNALREHSGLLKPQPAGCWAALGWLWKHLQEQRTTGLVKKFKKQVQKVKKHEKLKQKVDLNVYSNLLA